MPWLTVYTLNIDDLADAVGRQFPLKRAVQSRSALDPESISRATKRGQFLEVVHLNGMLAGLPNYVTFSTTQYAQRIADRDPMYARFVADLLTRSVVFVGTSLDESPLWQHIEIRGGRGERGMGELRPRSYLVSPAISKPRESLLARHNVVWLKMTAEEFAVEVLSEMTDLVAQGLTNLKELGEEVNLPPSGPIDVGQLRPDANQKTEFLIGQEPTWSDLVSGRAIARDVDAVIWETVQTSISGARPRKPIAIVGTAGSGKSTSLLRVALRLSNEGSKVVWIDRSLEISPAKIVAVASAPSGPSVIVIDDADRYGAVLSALVSDCAKAESMPLILMEMRSQHVDRCINSAQLKALAPTEITMPQLSNSDIEKLISALDRENRLGALKGLSLQQRRAAFRDRADRDLVVAMYEATTGLRFKERVVGELADLQSPANLIYATVALAASKRFDLSRDELLLSIGDSSNETLNEIDRLVRRGLLVAPRSAPQLLTCRHRRIGEFLLDGIGKYGFMPRVVSGLLTAGAAKAHLQMVRTSRSFRIIRTFLNHEFLHDSMEVQQGRDVYADIESLLHWDFHFWLHRGAFEVEWGDLGLAENFLAQAKGLMPNDAMVKNEWAYLLFKKAGKNPTSLDSRGMASDAYEILVQLTYDSVPRAHPYHVLGRQGLIWAQRGIADAAERGRYLDELRRHVARGLRAFPTSSYLRDLSGQLDQAYLSQAVR